MPATGTVAPRRARGVYVCAAPNGMIRLQAIDAEGDLFLELTVAKHAFEPHMVERAQHLLDTYDPVPPRLRLVPHAAAAGPCG